MRWTGGALIAAGLALAGCAAPMQAPPRPQVPVANDSPALSAEAAVRQFTSVVRTVEPVAERNCRTTAPAADCDFQIVVDDRPGQGVNAFQTLDSTGRPVLAFTLGLIADVRNPDELAFVMSHEAAHHILAHLDRQRVNATAGAEVFGGWAAATGVSGAGVELATRIGAALGARSYSKQFELEADALGARIAQSAGYDAVRGARYFTRIPDPGDRFLGTHPPNGDRMETVRRAVGG
ncbi:M48 family metallopeptidase [Pseudooceanicola aestuarii]|uniref:M48 family metallopeptidase n=1 Tax=Pseudooceanicola aestuarii TaxID=2697319 RepID=UPI0013D0F045|nr:M48 family metallopeptidase [Pseudooceanicola aestuarii]